MPDAPKKPRGRPAKGETKLKPISVRFDPPQARELSEAASQDKVTDAEWIRRAVTAALEARRPPK